MSWSCRQSVFVLSDIKNLVALKLRTRNERTLAERWLNERMNERWLTLKRHKALFMGLERHGEYYAELASTADTKPLPPVVAKIFNKSITNLIDDFDNFRNFDYEIIDDHTFNEIGIQKYWKSVQKFNTIVNNIPPTHIYRNVSNFDIWWELIRTKHSYSFYVTFGTCFDIN